MKIGMLTDSLADLPFDAMLDVSAELGIQCLEFGCGNWSSAPHLRLDAMLDSDRERREFTAKLAARGLSISALNCSGNPLHPGPEGKRQHEVTLKTFELAHLLGIEVARRVVGQQARRMTADVGLHPCNDTSHRRGQCGARAIIQPRFIAQEEVGDRPAQFRLGPFADPRSPRRDRIAAPSGDCVRGRCWRHGAMSSANVVNEGLSLAR